MRALVALVLVATAARGGEARGFGEVRAAWSPGASGNKVQVIERVRPTFEQTFSERLKLVATIEAGISEGRDTSEELSRVLFASDLGPSLRAAECEPTSRTNSLLHLDGVHDYLDVDRLYLDVYGARFDLRVGRQALNWGSARFINPTDPFPQVLLAEPWRPRRGVNAARVTVPIGTSVDVTAVLAANDSFTAGRVTSRVRVNWKGVDVAVVGAYRGDASNGLVGIDVRGTLGVGYWFEGAWLVSAKPHEVLSAGLDYSFPVLEQLVVFAQYSRDGSGLTKPDTYATAASRLALQSPIRCAAGSVFATPTGPADPFAPFTLGRDYLLVGASLGVLPEFSVSVTVLQNLNDGTALVLPFASWAVLDWLDVSTSVSVPVAVWGRGGEFRPRPEDLRVSVTTPSGVLTANLAGLVPAATVTLWSRANF